MRKCYLFVGFLIALLFSQIPAAAAGKSPAEINALYYNLNQTKLQSFKCQVATDAFDQIKERVYASLNEDEQRELDNFQFYLTYENGNLIFDSSAYPRFENENTTQGMKKVLDGIGLMLNGTFTSWKGVIAEPLIAVDEKYRITENKNGYTVTYKQAGNNVELTLNQDYLLEKASFRMDNQTMVVVPEFIPTKEGLLIAKIDLNIGDGIIREVITVNYQDIQGIHLPAEINLQMNMGQVSQELTIKCFDYQVAVGP